VVRLSTKEGGELKIPQSTSSIELAATLKAAKVRHHLSPPGQVSQTEKGNQFSNQVLVREWSKSCIGAQRRLKTNKQEPGNDEAAQPELSVIGRRSLLA